MTDGTQEMGRVWWCYDTMTAFGTIEHIDFRTYVEWTSVLPCVVSEGGVMILSA